MTRLHSVIGIAVFILLVASSAQAGNDTSSQGDNEQFESHYSTQIQEIMGDLHWKMSPKRVVKILGKRIYQIYSAKITETRGILEQDRIMQRIQEKIQRIKKSYTKFNGKITGWDISLIGPEFRHKSHESMLVSEEEMSRDYYFFINGRLWKYYREYKPEALGNRPFDLLGEAMQDRFGEAKTMQGEPYKRPWLEWSDNRTQLRMLNNGNSFALVLASQKTVDNLAILRKNALPRQKKKKDMLDMVMLETDQFGLPITKRTDPNENIAEQIIKKRNKGAAYVSNPKYQIHDRNAQQK